MTKYLFHNKYMVVNKADFAKSFFSKVYLSSWFHFLVAKWKKNSAKHFIFSTFGKRTEKLFVIYTAISGKVVLQGRRSVRDNVESDYG